MTKKYPMHVRVVVFNIALFVLLSSCKRTEQSNEQIKEKQTYADTSSAPMETAIADPDTEQTFTPPERHEVIDYPGYWEIIQDPSNAFEPFARLKTITTNFIHHKDSLRKVSDNAFQKQETFAYAAIMSYKREIESGKYSQGRPVGLLDLPRTLGDKDSSAIFLPAQRPSFFSNGNFFFLGGAPFVRKHIEYDTSTHQEITFKDVNGKPELRLQVADTENRYHLLKSIMQFRKPKVKIDFGGPVPVYDGPMDEVKGIGSVIHNFVDDIPVVFLMEDGTISGRLRYYQEPFTQQYSCYSSHPYVIFSCNSNIDPSQIVGIYIPYDDHVPSSCTVSRPNKWTWSADLDNDMIPDIACVIGTYDGVEEGVPELLWFININGTWKVVDYGEVPSCT